MEYCGNPLNLELIDNIVKIPSIEKVIKLGDFFMRLTDGFKEPYVRLLLTKGKTVEEQIEIYDALRAAYDEAFKQQQKEYEEWHKECNRWKDDFRNYEPLFDDKFTNAITHQGLNDIAFQLKFLNTPFEPDLGVLVQVHIYRNNPDNKVAILKGDWFREGDDMFGDVINWVNDRCILGTVALVNGPYCEDSRINQELYDLRMKNWSSRENVEDFLEILAPICEGKSLLDSYEFKQFYQNLFQDPWTLDPTTPYAQKRQSIIESLLAELQCGDPISADNPNETYEKAIADLNERIGYLEFELARTTSLLGELEAENDLLKHSQKDVAESENRQYSQTDNILFTPTALQLWKKLQEADLINAEYKPNKSKISDRKASIIAKILGTQLGLDPLWEPFEKLWNIRKLSNALSQTNNAKYRDSFEAEIRRVLD